MTLGGWIFMLVSVTAVASLAGFCFWRVLRAPDETDQTPAKDD